MNPFKRKEEGEEANPMAMGMVIGLVVAVIILAVALIFIFKGKSGATGVAANSGKTATTQKAEPQVDIRFTLITSKTCTDCFDLNLLVDSLKNSPNSPVKVTGVDTLDSSDAKAQALITKYKITKVPALIAAGSIDKNSTLKDFFTKLGTIENNVFVLRQVIPPYVDVASGQVKGVLSLTYLSDTACKECYDVKLHENALQALGMYIKDQKTVDVSSDEGKTLLKNYKITLVPTILIKGDTSEYPNFDQVWATVGKVDATDGTKILTDVSVMGNYFDLAKNKLVKPAPATTTAATTQTAPATAQ